MVNNLNYAVTIHNYRFTKRNVDETLKSLFTIAII